MGDKPTFARQLVADWAANPYAIHKRPPFRAHSFGGDDRFWVVGSTGVSVLGGLSFLEDWATVIADALNQAASTP